MMDATACSGHIHPNPPHFFFSLSREAYSPPNSASSLFFSGLCQQSLHLI
jgi:hypothetical protein